MEEVNLQAGFRSLQESLRRIQALLGWAQLRRSESGQVMAPTLADHTQSDLRSEYAFFLSTCMEIHSVLDDQTLNLSEEDRQRLKSRLARLERQVSELDVHNELGGW